MIFLYGFACIIAATTLASQARLPQNQSLTIGIEVGIQNVLFAILIASSPSMLNNEKYAIFPAMYGTFAYIVVLLYIWGFKKLTREKQS